MTDPGALLLAVLLLITLGVGVALGVLIGRSRSAAKSPAPSIGDVAAEIRAAAADSMATSTSQFLAVADERMSRGAAESAAVLAQREEAVRQLVEPLTRALAEVKQEVATAERSRIASHASLAEQVKAMRDASELLRGETSQLTSALRSSQVRGRWGELQLRRVVEAAGMLNRVDFFEQESVRTDDGAQRPDMIVRLAGGKQLVVDAKVAFLGYLEAAEATDPDARAAGMAAHARQVRAHIDSLAAKKYWEQFTPTPEFVVMFLPAEAFLHAALDVDPTLFERAIESNVILATPMTLLALLRTVAYTWRQEALAQNAQQVLDLGRELHSRIATMGGHFAKVGRAIESAGAAYNSTVASLETRVLVSARRFATLDVVDADLPNPSPAKLELKNLSAGELVASEEQGVVAIEDARESAHLDAP